MHSELLFGQNHSGGTRGRFGSAQCVGAEHVLLLALGLFPEPVTEDVHQIVFN